jgi:hypothetical protein
MPRHIEVKGRAAGADSVTITYNEFMYALNQGDKFILAIVFVNPDDSIDGPHYASNPFSGEPTSMNFPVSKLLAQSKRPT